MNWKVIKRNYHGEEPECMIRWVVCQDGLTRGICECWTEKNANYIADALNRAGVGQ